MPVYPSPAQGDPSEPGLERMFLKPQAQELKLMGPQAPVSEHRLSIETVKSARVHSRRQKEPEVFTSILESVRMSL